MNALRAVLRELAGLFVDDGWLAAVIVAVVVLAGICVKLFPAVPWLAGAVLLFGCLTALFVSVAKSARAT